MIAFRLLGPPVLTGPDGASLDAVLQQPKRLAVLAFIAASDPPGPVRRDVLLATFWPETDESRARASLRRALHFLRRAVGDALVSRGDTVFVDPALFWCDVRAFREAAAAGRFDEALTLYRGDLLEGFFVPSAPDVERWMDDERRRLRAQAADLARRWAEQAGERGAWDDAVRRARRAAALAPDDEGTFRILLTALLESGDRAGALKEYDRFVVRLREDLGLDPSPETEALAAAITRPAPAAGDAAAPSRVIGVHPFTVHGPEELGWLGEGMVDLLIAKLDGAGDLRAAARTDTEDGPRLTGSLVAAGGRLRGQAVLRQADGSEVRAEAEVAGESEVFQLVDTLVRGLLAQRTTSVGGQLGRLAAATTGSFSALRAYLEGEQAWRSGRYADAAAACERALADDARFALAGYRLATARDTLGLPEEARAACDAVWESRDRLASHARFLLESQAAWLAGELLAAEEAGGRVLQTRPDDVEAWYLFGHQRLHGDAWRGRAPADARRALERAVGLDPRHAAALTDLARLAAMDRRADDVAALSDRIAAAHPRADVLPVLRMLRALAAAGGEVAQADVAAVLRARPAILLAALTEAALLAEPPGAAETLAERVADVTTAGVLRAAPRLTVALLAHLRGDAAAAARQFDLAARMDPAGALLLRSALAVQTVTDAREDARARLAAWDPPAARETSAPGGVHDTAPAAFRAYLLGVAAAGAAEADEARRQADACAAAPGRGPAEGLPAALADGVRAAIAALDDPAEALRILERIPTGPWIHRAGLSPLFGLAGERLLRVRLLCRLGRRDEAAAWAAGLGARSPWERPFARAAAAALAE